jgi:transposase
MGTLAWKGRKLTVITSRTKRSADFIALLEKLDGFYGPKPGLEVKPVVMVLDNGPVHVSRAAKAALASRAHWLTAEWLPKYTPELNDIEPVWHDLKARHLAHLCSFNMLSSPDMLAIAGAAYTGRGHPGSVPVRFRATVVEGTGRQIAAKRAPHLLSVHRSWAAPQQPLSRRAACRLGQHRARVRKRG